MGKVPLYARGLVRLWLSRIWREGSALHKVGTEADRNPGLLREKSEIMAAVDDTATNPSFFGIVSRFPLQSNAESALRGYLAHKNNPPLGPYSRTMPRALRWS